MCFIISTRLRSRTRVVPLKEEISVSTSKCRNHYRLKEKHTHTLRNSPFLIFKVWGMHSRSLSLMDSLEVEGTNVQQVAFAPCPLCLVSSQPTQNSSHPAPRLPLMGSGKGGSSQGLALGRHSKIFFGQTSECEP